MRGVANKAVVGMMASIAAMTVSAGWEQTELEEILCHGCEPRDYFPEGNPPYVPHRWRNSLPEFQGFIGAVGWTTNQFIVGLICAITNNVDDEKWADSLKRRTAWHAAWKLWRNRQPSCHQLF